MGEFEQTQYSPTQLDEMLRSSFQAIRRDMEQLRATATMNASTIMEIRARMEQLREELVSKDKFNMQQIKVNEVQERIDDLKKIEEDMDKDVDRVYVEYNKVEKRLKDRVKDFEKKGTKELREFEQKNTDRMTLQQKDHQQQLGIMNRKLEENLIRLENKLRKHVNHFNEKTMQEFKDIKKQLTTLSQVRAEYSRISAAASDIKSNMQRIEKKGGEIFEAKAAEFAKVIENRTQQFELGITKAVQDQQRLLEGMKKHTESKISRSQIDKLIDDINREFGGLKDMITKEIARLDKEFEEKGRFVKSKRVDRIVTEINDEFDRMKDKVTFMEDSKISKSSFEQHLEEVKADVQNLREELIILRKDAMTHTDRKAELRAELRQAPKIMPKPRIYRKTGVAANVLLVVGFTLLILSIATYYTGYPTVTIILIAAGLVTAIVGTILKVIVALRARER